jgi:lysophospholipase L1-like esterase
MSLALKSALSPLLLAQALYTRRRTPRLPEAAGAREGEFASRKARERSLTLLIIGDSSAAGVGVATQDEALAGQLARALARRAGARVRWRLLARTGLNSLQLIDLWREAGATAADVAVVVSGVNDIVDQLRPERTLAARAELLTTLEREAGICHTVLTALPPMQGFTALPQPLRWLAGRDAAVHDRALARWAAGRPGASHLPFDMPLEPALLACDGFHPGAPLYRLWGRALADHIAFRIWPPA